MQTEEFSPNSIPWTTQDAWLGVAFLGLWWAATVLGSLLVGLFALDVNPGLLIALAELALLVPV